MQALRVRDRSGAGERLSRNLPKTASWS